MYTNIHIYIYNPFVYLKASRIIETVLTNGQCFLTLITILIIS